MIHHWTSIDLVGLWLPNRNLWPLSRRRTRPTGRASYRNGRGAAAPAGRDRGSIRAHFLADQSLMTSWILMLELTQRPFTSSRTLAL